MRLPGKNILIVDDDASTRLLLRKILETAGCIVDDAESVRAALEKIQTKLSIQEVNPLGFTLVSTHLVKKGSSFWLSGKALKKIVPSADTVFVTVLGSATQMTEEERRYQIKVEVDPAQEDIVRDIKTFLNTVRAGA